MKCSKCFICCLLIGIIGISTVFAANSGIKSAEVSSIAITYRGSQLNLNGQKLISVVMEGSSKAVNYIPVSALEALGYSVIFDSHLNAFVILSNGSASITVSPWPTADTNQNIKSISLNSIIVIIDGQQIYLSGLKPASVVMEGDYKVVYYLPANIFESIGYPIIFDPSLNTYLVLPNEQTSTAESFDLQTVSEASSVPNPIPDPTQPVPVPTPEPTPPVPTPTPEPTPIDPTTPIPDLADVPVIDPAPEQWQTYREFFDLSSFPAFSGYSECVPYIGGWYNTPEQILTDLDWHCVEYLYNADGIVYLDEYYGGIDGYIRALEKHGFLADFFNTQFTSDMSKYCYSKWIDTERTRGIAIELILPASNKDSLSIRITSVTH